MENNSRESWTDKKSEIEIRKATGGDAPAIARVLRESIRTALPFLPVLHSTDEDLQYIYSKMLPNNEVFVAHEADDRVVAFISFDTEWVRHLYVLPGYARRGIGERLLNLAKSKRSKLALWTFQRNEIARQFYSKNGFIPITETDGAENEEREPDVLFEWNRGVEFSASYLTGLLLASGALQSGSVVDVRTEGMGSHTGAVQRLSVAYSCDAVPSLPNRIVAKRVKISLGFGTRELDLYRLIQAKKLQVPLPSCLAWESDDTSYTLLLEDLSATHKTDWDFELSAAQAQTAAAATADLHALYWGQNAETAHEQAPTRERIQEYIAIASQGLNGLLSDADFLERKDVRLIEDIMINAEQAYMRLADGAANRLTLTHSDPNPGNILYPRMNGGKAYLIDRQPFDWTLSFWLGASDLALMMVQWWPTELRRKLERVVVQAYVNRLLERGIECSFDAIWNDYRVCATQCLLGALSRCRYEHERTRDAWVWKPKLKKTLVALEDLESILLFR